MKLFILIFTCLFTATAPLFSQLGKYTQKLENDICTDIVIGKFTCTGCAASDKDLSEDVREDVFKALQQFKYCTVLNRDNLYEIIKLANEEEEIATLNENQKKRAKELYTTAQRILLGHLKIQSDGSLRIKIEIASLSDGQQGAFDIIAVPANQFEIYQTRYPHIEKGIVNMLLGGSTQETKEKPAEKKQTEYGLVAHYPFNGNTMDESGLNNHGSVIGAKLCPNRFNQPNSAYFFNGVSDYIVVPNHPSLCPPNFTISLWASLSAQTASNYLRLLSKHLNEPGSYGSYQLLTGTLDQPLKCIGTAITTQGYKVSESNTSVAPGWRHLVLTYDGEHLSLYLDNVLLQQEACAGRIKYDSNPLYIARDGFYNVSYFKGAIDDVKIYNRALLPDEITTLFDAN